MKIKIVIQGKEVELDPDEAKRVYAELDRVFGGEKVASPSPTYIPISIPYPVPSNPTPPWHEPFSPWTIICGDTNPAGESYSCARN